MKRDARHTDTTTNNIITTNIGGMHEEVLAKLPRIDTIRRDVRRQRAVNRPYPEIPENTLFEIPIHTMLAARVSNLSTMTIEEMTG